MKSFGTPASAPNRVDSGGASFWCLFYQLKINSPPPPPKRKNNNPGFSTSTFSISFCSSSNSSSTTTPPSAIPRARHGKLHRIRPPRKSRHVDFRTRALRLYDPVDKKPRNRQRCQADEKRQRNDGRKHFRIPLCGISQFKKDGHSRRGRSGRGDSR